MDRTFGEDLAIIFGVLLLGPIVIIAGIWIGIWFIAASPVLLAAFLIYLFIKRKGWKVVLPKVPHNAVPIREYKKPATIRWKGKDIPIWVFVISIVFSIIFAITLVFAMLFWLPPIITVLILGFMSARMIGKRVK